MTFNHYNKEKCERYEKAMTREKNKARRAAKRAKKEAYFARRKAEREALNE